MRTKEAMQFTQLMRQDITQRYFQELVRYIYIDGLNSASLSLPTLAIESKIDESAVEKLKQIAQRLLGSPDDLVVIRLELSACYDLGNAHRVKDS